MYSPKHRPLAVALLLPFALALALAVLPAGLFAPPVQAGTALEPASNVDLYVSKYANSAPISGTNLNFQYSINYGNSSANAASNVVITDVLPPGVSYGSQYNYYGWSVVASTNMVTWTKSSLAAYEYGYIYLNVVLDSNVPGGTVLTNTIAINSDDADTSPANNVAIALVTVISPTRDVYVSKSLLYGSSPIPGHLITYSLGYGNYSYPANAAAANVVMTDTLPPGAAFITATGYGLITSPVVSGNQVIFNLGTLPAYSNYGLQYSVYVTDTEPIGTPFTNTVEISTSDLDVNLLNNQAVHATPVLSPGVDLIVSKYLSWPYDTLIGFPFSYQINYSNQRPDTASNPVIVDRLPAGLSVVSAGDYWGQWTVVTSTHAVTWTRAALGPYESGSSLYLNVRLADNVTPNSYLTNTISITSTSIELNAANNTFELPVIATAPPSVSFGGPLYGVNENGGSAVVVVQLNRSLYYQTVSVDYSAYIGTAGVTDFAPVSGRLYFYSYSGNTTAYISIPITNDLLYEGDETFKVALSNPNFATLGALPTTTVLIVNDDPLPDVQFSSNAFSYDEHAGSAAITTTLNAPAGITVTVAYSTANGSAIAGVDYQAAAGSLTFAPGVTQKSFAVPLISDLAADPIKTVSLSLSAPVNATLGALNLATLFIVDPNIDANPVPVITALSPISVTAGGPTFTLTLIGTNFVGGSIVRWNGSARATTYISGTQVQAVVPAADIVASGTVTLTVFNPGPGGGESTGVALSINDRRKLYLPLISR